jgi:hypothetical protein
VNNLKNKDSISIIFLQNYQQFYFGPNLIPKK